MNYILYHHEYSGDKYTEMIQDSMEAPCNLVAKRGENNWYERTQHEKTWKHLGSIKSILWNGKNNVINWGNRIFANDDYFRLNVPSAISKTSNKRTARRLLQEAKVSVPYTVFPEPNMSTAYYQDVIFPVIARPFRHLKGRDFHVLNTVEELMVFLWGKNVEDWYVSEVFNKTHEFRIHVAHGKVLLVHQKSFAKGNIMETSEVNSGFWRVLDWSEFNPALCIESIKASEVLGLDYAAVDIMWNAHDNSMAICELNTDPDVGTPYVSGKYAKYFDWAIGNDFPSHFPVSGTSVFYPEILKERS